MDKELKQTQLIAPEDYYGDNEVETIQHDNIATLEHHEATDNEINVTPNSNQPPAAPVAPKKSRKSTGKGKQPAKRLKLNFDEDEENANTEENTASLGKFISCKFT